MKIPCASSTENLPSPQERTGDASLKKLIFLIRGSNFGQASIELAFKRLKYARTESLAGFLKSQRRRRPGRGRGIRQLFGDSNGRGWLRLFVGGEAFLSFRGFG